MIKNKLKYKLSLIKKIKMNKKQKNKNEIT